MLKNIFRENKILKNNSKGRHAIYKVSQKKKELSFFKPKKSICLLCRKILQIKYKVNISAHFAFFQ